MTCGLVTAVGLCKSLVESHRLLSEDALRSQGGRVFKCRITGGLLYIVREGFQELGGSEVVLLPLDPTR